MDRIVEIYGPIVFGRCRRKGLADDDARDVTQEIFLAVSQGLDAFRRDKPDDSFLHWLRTIARNKIADWFRRAEGKAKASGGTTAHLLIEQVTSGGTEDADQDGDWQLDNLRQSAFERAVAMMKTDFRENTWKAFWETVVLGRETADVADELGMKQGAVRQARSKVRKRLVEELGDLLDLDQEKQEH